jgi:hypothetical protein
VITSPTRYLSPKSYHGFGKSCLILSAMRIFSLSMDMTRAGSFHQCGRSLMDDAPSPMTVQKGNQSFNTPRSRKTPNMGDMVTSPFTSFQYQDPRTHPIDDLVLSQQPLGKINFPCPLSHSITLTFKNCPTASFNA